MGIRSMLRKVFGRDREDTPATSAVPPQTRETPKSTTPDTPEAAARRAADDLVAASFDNPQIPRARAKTRAAGREGATATVTAGATEEPTSAAETEGSVAPAAEAAAEKPTPAADAKPTAEATEEPAPAADVEPQGDAAPETTAVAADAPEPTAEATEEPAPAAETEAAADAPKAEADATATAEPAPVAADADAAGAAEAVADADAVDAAPQEQAEAEAAPQATADTEPEAAATADADATTADTETAPQEQAVEPEAAGADAVDAAPQEQAEAEATADADATTADAEAAPQEQAVEPEAAAADAAPQEQAEAEAAPQATADAEPEAAPEAEADEPAVATADAEAAPQEQAAATGAQVPAVALAKVKADAPHLVEAYKAAGAQLKKQGLAGARAAVYLVVDRSGSMRGYFKDGSVQRLAEQVTALAAHLDEDATVTTVFFSTDIDGTVDLTPAGLTPTRVDEVNATLGRLGRTNYHRAVEEVLAHHEKADATRPALVVFQTDGAPESKTAATQALAEAAGRPLHWRFVAWGEEDGKAFDYLRKLDGTPRTGTYFAGATPVETAHPAFYRGLLAGLEF
ncbi:hypothetical protein DEJ45_18695 [Streptomyces venezuelae]|uniref:VWA domain-containing protein n=1 Tax=Streptomyces venezuelae TaxID=54571 RepID=UPI00123CAA1E|nr:VWA domain-containing protein [Streptomyces venezuelae]QES14227.1 hypothetical protein DEJ45_18695 [Streptomyces venezuelae]